MRVYPNKVPRIVATFGVQPGYNNKSQKDVPAEVTVMMRIQKISEEYFKETGRYCSFVVFPTQTIYRCEWGCPPGGEMTYTIQSTPDPERCVTEYNRNQYVKDCKNIILEIAKSFDQCTVRIEIDTVLCNKYVMK